MVSVCHPESDDCDPSTAETAEMASSSSYPKWTHVSPAKMPSFVNLTVSGAAVVVVVAGAVVVAATEVVVAATEVVVVFRLVVVGATVVVVVLGPVVVVSSATIVVVDATSSPPLRVRKKTATMIRNIAAPPIHGNHFFTPSSTFRPP
jgi:hypothetical protein